MTIKGKYTYQHTVYLARGLEPTYMFDTKPHVYRHNMMTHSFAKNLNFGHPPRNAKRSYAFIELKKFGELPWVA